MTNDSDTDFPGGLHPGDTRNLAEAALRESERQSRLIVDSIPGFITAFTPAGELEFVNRPVVEYFGKTLEELKHWGTGGMTHPEDLPRVVELFVRSVAAGEPFEFEVRARRFDGVYRWFQSRGFPLRDTNGQIVRWYNLLIDIDERKRAADALRRSENFLLEVQRLSHTGGWRYDAATDTVESSAEIRRGYDVQPGEDASRPAFWFERIHPDDRARVQGEFERCLREGTAYQAAYRIVRPDGGIRYQHVTGHPVVSDAGELVEFVGAAMDMTEHWQATNELERASEALRELQVKMSRATQVATMSELAASIAHEVNQPLSGIITNANTCLRMLAGDLPNLDGARETLRRTLRDGNRAADVITRLRALFSKKDFTVESLDLNEVTREVVSLSLSHLQRNRIILHSQLVDELPPINGDRIQLQQVILNLLRNASDAMLDVHDRPRQLLVETGREDGGRVRLSVRDAGVGLDQQSLEKLFEAFYTTKREGMGVGLSISRSIIERHQGRLWAEPNEGPGATFSFSIPCRPGGVADSAPAPHH